MGRREAGARPSLRRPSVVDAAVDGLRRPAPLARQVAADPDPASKQVADIDELVPGVMTAVRVLTRVLPFLLEDYRNHETGEVDPDLERLFWASEALVSPPLSRRS